MKLEPGPRHASLRELVEEFAQSTVRAQAESADRLHRFPREVVVRAAELGLMGMLVPPEYGGAGLDHLGMTIAVEEIARACASAAVVVDVHNSVATEPILLFGTEEQKRAWLPRLARGEVLGAFALTEPGSGSDAADLQTSARRCGGEWVLSGTKVFITNVGEAGMYLLFARTGPGPRAAGVSAFIVPAQTPGLRVGQVFEKMGLHGSPTGELVLEEARLPGDSLLGKEGGGFAVAMRALDSGRIGISGQALGIARAALAEVLDCARAADGVEQGAAFLLADMATRVQAARQLAYHAATLCGSGRPFTGEASMAKLFCTDVAMEVASEALTLAADWGCTDRYPFERHFRDAKALQIYEGTNQVQRLVIARHLLGEAASRPAPLR